MYGSRRNSPPTWFVMLIGIALVFGGFRIWQELQNFFRGGGVPNAVATRQVRVTATRSPADIVATRFPTMTDLPPCEMYLVDADSINVRSQPTVLATSLELLSRDTAVCVIARDSEWFLIDRDTRTRRLEAGYIFAALLRSANPTPTRTPSPRPMATITLTFTPTATTTPSPTRTP